MWHYSRGGCRARMKSIHYFTHRLCLGQQAYRRAETPNPRPEKRVVTRLSNCFWRERVATCSHVLLYDVNANTLPSGTLLDASGPHDIRGWRSQGRCKLDLDVQRRGSKGKRYRTLAPDLSRVMVGRLSPSTTSSTSGQACRDLR